MNPKVLVGSIAGVAVFLVAIGGTWVILNSETLTAKAIELGVKLAVKRGVQLTPETVKLLLELSGGAAGATAGAAGQATASTGRRTTKATQSAGRRTTKATQSAGRQATKATRSAGQRARGGPSGAVRRPAAQRPTA